MNIEEAIEILGKLERTLAPTMDARGTDAIKLGIEALKRVKRLRPNECYANATRLPGETKE